MAKNSDNVFELGLVYQAIMELRELHDKLGKYNMFRKDIAKTITKLKVILVKEVEKL